jgi:hypothetical protein
VIDPPGPPSKQGFPSLNFPRFANRLLAALILAALLLAIGYVVRF